MRFGAPLLIVDARGGRPEARPVGGTPPPLRSALVGTTYGTVTIVSPAGPRVNHEVPWRGKIGIYSPDLAKYNVVGAESPRSTKYMDREAEILVHEHMLGYSKLPGVRPREGAKCR